MVGGTPAGGREVTALHDTARAGLAVADCHWPSNGGVMQTMGKWKCMCPGAVRYKEWTSTNGNIISNNSSKIRVVETEVVLLPFCVLI